MRASLRVGGRERGGLPSPIILLRVSDHDASEVDASVSCSTSDVIGKSVEDILGSRLSVLLNFEFTRDSSKVSRPQQFHKGS